LLHVGPDIAPSLLSEKGVIDALSYHDGEPCYLLCGEAHHRRLVCSSCHRVVEIRECEIDDWLSRVSAQHDFVTTGHTIELTGLCPLCR